MSSSKIEELKRRRQKEIKKKNSQIPYGILFLVASIIVFGLFLKFNYLYSMFWIIGILLGITLQRSRFCFTAGFRDPILVGSTSILKSVIIGLVIGTIGFGVIQYTNQGSINIIPGQVYPVGIHTAIGAVLFGIGMVIAGGCASGTLMRIGEGFQLRLVVLVGFIIGTLLGARNFEFWDKLFVHQAPTVHLPQYLGYPAAIIGQIIMLALLYFLADWYDKRNSIMKI